MLREQKGFSLVELLITMIIFLFVIAAASQLLVGILTQFKQQSKIAETNIEGLVGLQIFKNDIESAGIGLPFLLNTGYIEVPAGNAGNAYNDAPNAPRAVVIDNNVAGELNNSDVLVVKSVAVGANAPSEKWTYMTNTGTAANSFSIKRWDALDGQPIISENLQNGDRVIVLRIDDRMLLGNTTFNSDPNNADWTGLRPTIGLFRSHLIYGINANDYLMPFNRVDYHIDNTNIPAHCAPATGVLIKNVINQSNGQRGGGMPILDCVADMQVVLGLDTNSDGQIDLWSSAMPALDAEGIRRQLKQVRVYILAHEGQRDSTYTYPTNIINITDPDAGNLKAFNLLAIIGADFSQFRWKIYTINAKLRIN
ncbi:MAG: prepilin-type N-terminal cleavage/methylation domain-containing protein [Porphyromonadaceae bacterium]|nr:prepilin-type N-terminal cleavage/methylation domain-containing protein [Porphyromonadaceae bacterium]